ncbi:hypothetical protein BW261_25845 [Klebsiella aerogenes]|nr:hypothetical protein BW261_25845 [Klebsiella aerogenes]
MVMTVFAGIAEFERELIRGRTSAGRISAKKRGVKFGRPQRLSPDQKKLARRLLCKLANYFSGFLANSASGLANYFSALQPQLTPLPKATLA